MTTICLFFQFHFQSGLKVWRGRMHTCRSWFLTIRRTKQTKRSKRRGKLTRKGEGWERRMRERQISALKPKQASVNVLVPLRMQMNTLGCL